MLHELPIWDTLSAEQDYQASLARAYTDSNDTEGIPTDAPIDSQEDEVTYTVKALNSEEREAERLRYHEFAKARAQRNRDAKIARSKLASEIAGKRMIK